METDNSGAVQAIYNYGYGLISMTKISGISEICGYYNYDGLGTVRQLTDSSEAVTVSYMYDSFGNLLASSGTSNNPYGFTGQQQFSEADNLVFLRARYYSPNFGRFISRDPIGYEDGINLYAYVRNNASNKTDSTGKKTDKISCLGCISCMAAFGFSCAALCYDNPKWDCPDDTFSDCFNKCWKSIKDSNPWIHKICWGSCVLCGIQKVPNMPKISKL